MKFEEINKKEIRDTEKILGQGQTIQTKQNIKKRTKGNSTTIEVENARGQSNNRIQRKQKIIRKIW